MAVIPAELLFLPYATKRSITKTRKSENTKNNKGFRAFPISCFRDQIILFDTGLSGLGIDNPGLEYLSGKIKSRVRPEQDGNPLFIGFFNCFLIRFLAAT